MNRLLHFVADVLRNRHFIVFSLFGGMLYFSQLYAKLGYIATSAMFEGNVWLSSITAGVFGLFAGTSNTALVITNRSNTRDRSLYLMAFDILISLFFYGGVCWEAFNKQDSKSIGTAMGAVLMGIYSSVLIYFLSEQFREDNAKETEAASNETSLKARITAMIAGLGVSLPITEQSVAQLVDLLAESLRKEQDATKLMAGELGLLRPLAQKLQDANDTIAGKTQALADALEELKGKDSKIKDLTYQLEQANKELKDSQEAVQSAKNTRELSTEKGNLQKFVKAGEWDKARRKRAEIHERFGVWLEVEIPEEIAA
jgi:FtsZ-binding cell division protein ZapB